MSPTFAPSAAPPQVRQSWWRSLWFRRESRLTEIRCLMLQQLPSGADNAEHRALADQIAAADHPEVLWSLRHELTQVLVNVHGEALARRRLTDISFMFAGLLERQRHASFDAADFEDDTGWPPSAARRERMHLDH